MSKETLTEYELTLIADFLAENADAFHEFIDERESGTGETVGDLLIDKLQAMARLCRQL